MEEKAGLFADIEKMKMLSSIMGGQSENMDIASMMDMAKKMNAVMNLFNGPKADEPQKPEIVAAQAQTDGVEVIENKPEKMIHAAIPFLDQEYQKDLYIIVRLMEMRRMLGQTEAIIESRSRTVKAIEPAQRRRQLLQAMRPFLNATERSHVDQMAKLMEVRQIMDRRDN